MPYPCNYGYLELNTSLANSSSLKAHNSSIEPPPRAKIITSKSFILFNSLIPLIMSALALVLEPMKDKLVSHNFYFF